MENWVLLYEENNLSYLLKKPGKKVCKYAKFAFENLKDELIDNFGANKEWLQILNYKIEIYKYYAEQIIINEKSNQVFIDVIEWKINELLQKNKNQKFDMYDNIIAMETALKRDIDLKKTTVFMFYKNGQRLKTRTK